MPNGRASLKGKMRRAVLIDRIDVAGPEVAIMRFRPQDGELFTFTAGQYATLGLDVGDDFVARAYSIASSPYERRYLELYINIIKQGQLTPALFDLRIGDEVYYMGPKGVFTLAKTASAHLLFVATGTGLAPYVSMLRALHADACAGKPHGKSITLMHGVRFTADLGYRWELDGYQRDADFGFVYLPMVSRHENDPYWSPDVGGGRVTELLKHFDDAGPSATEALPRGLDARAVFERFPLNDTAVYLCGNPDMIAEAKTLLKQKGHEEIYTEEYW